MKTDDSQQPIKVLGERLRAAREAAGLSQTKLAKLLGVAKQTISAWEVGKQPPMITTILKISAVLGVDIRELFAGLSDDLSVKDFADQRISAAGSMLPLYGDEEQCGAAIMELDVRSDVPIRSIATALVYGPKDVAYIVNSKANEPKLHLGDRVILRVGAAPEPEQFVFAVVQGEFVLRRYLPKEHKSSVGAILRAENKAFPDRLMDEKDQILGVMAEYSSANHD